MPRQSLTIACIGCHGISRAEVQPDNPRRLDCSSWRGRRSRTSWFAPLLVAVFVSPQRCLSCSMSRRPSSRPPLHLALPLRLVTFLSRCPFVLSPLCLVVPLSCRPFVSSPFCLVAPSSRRPFVSPPPSSRLPPSRRLVASPCLRRLCYVSPSMLHLRRIACLLSGAVMSPPLSPLLRCTARLWSGALTGVTRPCA